MDISVVNPVERAMRRTKLVLFSPFDFGKWLKLGFCAFLMQLGQGGGGGFNVPTNVPRSTWPVIEQWIRSHVTLFIALVSVGALLVLGLTMLLLWLSSRGTFMFIDGLARNRGAIGEPWREYRSEGNRLWGFVLLFWVVSMIVLMSLIGGAIAIAWPDIQADRFGGAALVAVVFGGSLLILAALGMAIVGWLLNAFVVPVMYLRRTGVRASWCIAWREVIADRVGVIALYMLMSVLVTVTVGLLMGVVTCATCCLPAIPYVGSVILLPLLVFLRCYSLCFLEQFGPDWQFMSLSGWPPTCGHCGYDLRGLPAGSVCPECGHPAQPSPLPDTAPP